VLQPGRVSPAEAVIKRALLSTLLIAGIAIAGGKKLHPEVAIDEPPTNFVIAPAGCFPAEEASWRVFETLGFKLLTSKSSGNMSSVAYEWRMATHDWRDASSKVGRAVNMSGGLLAGWYDVHPTEAELILSQSWIEQDGYACRMMLNLDWVGFKRGFLLEGHEYVQSTKAMENLILDLVRYHLDAQGKLAKDSAAWMSELEFGGTDGTDQPPRLAAHEAALENWQHGPQE
jgi:hypothetical protein